METNGKEYFKIKVNTSNTAKSSITIRNEKCTKDFFFKDTSGDLG